MNNDIEENFENIETLNEDQEQMQNLHTQPNASMESHNSLHH